MKGKKVHDSLRRECSPAAVRSYGDLIEAINRSGGMVGTLGEFLFVAPTLLPDHVSRRLYTSIATRMAIQDGRK